MLKVKFKNSLTVEGVSSTFFLNPERRFIQALFIFNNSIISKSNTTLQPYKSFISMSRQNGNEHGFLNIHLTKDKGMPTGLLGKTSPDILSHGAKKNLWMNRAQGLLV